MKRILSALLCLGLTASFFIGCSQNNTDAEHQIDSQDTLATEITSENEKQLDIEIIDWEGREFRILGRDESEGVCLQNMELTADEVTGDVINDSVFERNSYIMAHYNAEVTASRVPRPWETIQKYVNSGEDAVDIVFTTLYSVNSLSTGGFFTDISSLPYVDYSNPWWNANVNESLSIDGKLYYTTSSFNLLDKNRTYIIVFNKNLAEDFGLGDMYELTKNGAFTVEKATEFAKAIAADLDGDGNMTGVDRFGWTMDSYNAFTAQIQAMNNHFVTKNSDDLPEITMNNERIISSIDKALELCSNKETSLSCEMFGDWGISVRTFDAGRSLFTVMFIDLPGGLKARSANCEHDYGVLPLPKYDENQENYISVPDPSHAALISVPMTNLDLDFTGYMLELLSYTSDKMVMPAFYETTAKGKYTYDEASGEMLDIIFENPLYDLGVVYNWGNMSNIIYNIGMAGQNNFASAYAGIETSAQNAMEDTLDLILSLS